MVARAEAIAGVVVAVLLAGCSSPAGQPSDPDAPDDPNVHVYTSNQSFDDPTADILVTIDGEAVFDGKAEVEGQHNWMLREAKVAAGRHTVVALERETDARESMAFDVPAGEERWIVVDFWNPMSRGSGEAGSGPGFTISVHEEQVYFA
ncbi:MAG TPA: hypothetical protein VJ874_00805 [Candidatus Thermoplasmatota archaeon]|nr:hypothetical protein [Candidatus Thermoplasmatota archaeon]